MITRFSRMCSMGLVALLGASFAHATPAPVSAKVQLDNTAIIQTTAGPATIDQAVLAVNNAVVPCSLAACAADFVATNIAITTADPAGAFAVTTTTSSKAIANSRVIKDTGGTANNNGAVANSINNGAYVADTGVGNDHGAFAVAVTNTGSQTSGVDSHYGGATNGATGKVVAGTFAALAVENTAQQSAAG